ncbi:MAG: hypothetical protein LBR56_01825 [Sporomusaceae bacterium]|jgi:hypothetical protein|nr:hypothetical protein [Sporomusaceae bacterium]
MIMLMHHMKEEVGKDADLLFWQPGGGLSTEVFRPLSQRIGSELAPGLENLQSIVSAGDFKNYIESIISLKVNNNSLWLIVDSPLHRSLLEHKFRAALKEAFQVEYVRVVSQK